MGIIATVTWTRGDGTRTGADRYPPVSSVADIWPTVMRGVDEARRAHGADIVVLVSDDVAWRTLYRIIPIEAE